MEQIWTVLPFVAFLACPLMMVFCFFGMRKKGCAAPGATEAQAASQLPEERVLALQQQLHAIQAEMTTLQAADAHVPQAGASRGDDRLVAVRPGAVDAARSPA